MQKELIKEIIVNVVGKSAEKIADLLDTKKHVNEFLIADKLEITINQTRNLLYKLSDFGLVSSIRKKDKKKGWYTYFWRIENLKALEFLKSLLEKKLEQIHIQIKNRESKQFYVCDRCKVEFTEENALFMNFTCGECGDVFTLKDNSKLIRELKKNLIKFEKELSTVSEEIEMEKQKNDKLRLKEIDKEKKEKSKIRAAKAEERRKNKPVTKSRSGLPKTLNSGSKVTKKVVKKKVKNSITKKAVKKKKV